jgi:hypothetical protein
MKVGNHVTSARTLSLAIIALGYLGWQLGMFHNDRADLYVEVIDVATIGWIDQQVREKRPPFDTWNRTSPLEVPDSPFGVLRIGNLTNRTTGDGSTNSSPMRVSVVGGAGQFTTRAARFSNEDIGERAKVWNTVARELGTKLNGQIVERNAETVNDARQFLYQRQLTVPGIDIVTFNSEKATWIVSILCFLILVVVRNRINGIFQDASAGKEEPWLILDARLPMEKAIAAVWLAGIALSGWLANVGPILASIELERTGEIDPVSLGFATAAVLLLMSGSSWVGLKIVSDLLCLRKIRSEFSPVNQIPE